MDEARRLEVFRAQVENVRSLERAWTHVNRQVNEAIRQNNKAALDVNTKILALLYCALAEAVFSKLIHTPHGLTLDEIAQVKRESDAQGVKAGWQKSASLGMARVGGAKSNHNPNVLQRLSGLIDHYIFDPSVLRNKLAHGQWSVALNRDNTARNEQVTMELEELEVVELYRRRMSLSRLARILEDIIESPNRAHHKDYWNHLEALEADEKKAARWTLTDKAAQLQLKKSFAQK
jgi:hypothetical protein